MADRHEPKSRSTTACCRQSAQDQRVKGTASELPFVAPHRCCQRGRAHPLYLTVQTSTCSEIASASSTSTPRGSGPCSRSSCGRAATALLEGCPSFGRSASPWFGGP